MQEAMFEKLKKGFTPIYSANFVPLFKTLSPDRIDI